MTAFAIAAALLVAGVLMMLLPPLWRPAAALGDAPPPARGSALGIALALPVAAVAGYLWLGEPQALRRADAVAPPAGAGAGTAGSGRHDMTPERLQQMATALSERLALQPGDAAGWAMLGRAYTLLGRHRDAVMALRRADALAPGDARLLADLADVSAFLQGKRFAGEPARLVQRALDADPRHPKALALAGTVSFEARDYAAARGYWERAVAQLPPGSEAARGLQASIADATRLDRAEPAAASAEASALQGEVRLSPALAASVQPGDTLFVLARATDGQRMPLAVLKRPVGAWPAPFLLDDAMAMAPNLRLSNHREVRLSVRISRSGLAAPQPGDLVGEAGPLAPGTRGLQLLVDRVQP